LNDRPIEVETVERFCRVRIGRNSVNTMTDAIRFFEDRLAFQTDVSDVHAATDVVVIDARGKDAWDQGHIPGAIHLPHADIPARAAELLDQDRPVVTYCWGPGCNGATRAALALAKMGYDVREMIGGVEYWVREGFPLRTASGDVVLEVDPLTAPSCGC
jgi:rhodanese-related sulfurtransferase